MEHPLEGVPQAFGALPSPQTSPPRPPSPSRERGEGSEKDCSFPSPPLPSGRGGLGGEVCGATQQAHGTPSRVSGSRAGLTGSPLTRPISHPPGARSWKRRIVLYISASGSAALAFLASVSSCAWSTWTWILTRLVCGSLVSVAFLATSARM